MLLTPVGCPDCPPSAGLTQHLPLPPPLGFGFVFGFGLDGFFAMQTSFVFERCSDPIGQGWCVVRSDCSPDSSPTATPKNSLGRPAQRRIVLFSLPNSIWLTTSLQSRAGFRVGSYSELIPARTSHKLPGRTCLWFLAPISGTDYPNLPKQSPLCWVPGYSVRGP